MLSVRTVLLLFFAASFSCVADLSGILSADAASKPATLVAASTVVKAAPREVWKSIQKYRTCEPARRKLVSYKNGMATIEESFFTLPVLGSTSCTYAEHEHPYSRIDYSLVTSDKLTAFDGCWILIPVNGGKNTLVRLSCRLNTRINAPMKRQLITAVAKRDMNRRLKFIRQQSH